jgi:hypothetical protein
VAKAKQKRTKRRKRRKYRRAPKPRITKEAAKEVGAWLAPLSRSKTPVKGLHSLVRVFQVWIASRWGLRLKPKAWARYLAVRRAISLWNPAPLFREMRTKWHVTRLFAKLYGYRFVFHVPKNTKVLPKGDGRAMMSVRLHRLRRMPFQKYRPYRFVLHSFADIPPVNIKRIDGLLKHIIVRLSAKNLHVPVPAKKQLFRSLPAKMKHSRRVVNWLTSRFPITARLLDRYVTVSKVLEPMGKGFMRMDLRVRFRMSALKRDYPASARRILRGSKNRIVFALIFFDKKKRYQWLKWTYHSRTMEHRYQAVLTKGGFALCNRSWRPVSGPWRPTVMDSSFMTQARFQMNSKRFRVKAKNIWMRWDVKGSKQGASLGIAMSSQPRFKVKGGEILRMLARVFISGGVERLANRFLRNMAFGDQGKGLRFEWKLVEFPKRARVHFRMKFPMAPDKTLTSILRLLPAVMRQARSRRRRKRKSRKPTARRKRKLTKKKKARRRRRRRRRFAPLWKRLFKAIRYDLYYAKRVLAKK